MSSGVDYCEYVKGGQGQPILLRSVSIKGGANVATKQIMGINGLPIYTPKAGETKITDEELEFLERNKTFQAHKEKGFITVHKKSISIDKVVSLMTPKDKSAPKTPQDYKNVSSDGKGNDVINLQKMMP